MVRWHRPTCGGGRLRAAARAPAGMMWGPCLGRARRGAAGGCCRARARTDGGDDASLGTSWWSSQEEAVARARVSPPAAAGRAAWLPAGARRGSEGGRRERPHLPASVVSKEDLAVLCLRGWWLPCCSACCRRRRGGASGGPCPHHRCSALAAAAAARRPGCVAPRTSPSSSHRSFLGMRVIGSQ